MDACTICLTHTEAIHWHHTVPRSRGGEDSLQIPLCGDCHTLLHANAVYLAARIRNPKRRKKQTKIFFTNPEDRERAQPYLEILTQAILLPIPEGLSREHLVSASVGTSLFEAVHALKLDIGASNLEKTLLYCIEFTLRAREDVVDEKSKNNAACDDLWFLPVSRT